MAWVRLLVVLLFLVVRFSGCGPGETVTAGGSPDDSASQLAGALPVLSQSQVVAAQHVRASLAAVAGAVGWHAGEGSPRTSLLLPAAALTGSPAAHAVPPHVAQADGLAVTVTAAVLDKALEGADPAVAAAVRRTYEANGHAPLFLDPHREIGPTNDLLRFLASVHELGLDPFDFGFKGLLARTRGHCKVAFAGKDDAVDAVEHKLRQWVTDPPPPLVTLECDRDWMPETGKAASFDAALARAYFGLALALSGPLEPTVLWDGPESAVSLLASLLPDTGRYWARVAALRRYLPYWSTNSLPTLERWGQLRPGDFGPRVGKLKERLVAEGFLAKDAAAAGGRKYDDATRDAVMRFREAYGLKTSGSVDKPAMEALSRDAKYYVEQLWLSLRSTVTTRQERGEVFVLVNIPEFMTYLVVNGRVTDSYRSVVGFPYEEPGGRTPVVSSSVGYIDLNPEWVPTPYVVDNELKRKEKKEPGYLARNGFSFRDGKLVQKPGPGNTLGQVVIAFANENNVSLHGSSDPKPFTYADRALSHGCVRVEDIDHLAARLFALTNVTLDPALPEVLDQVMEKRVTLPVTVPVYVVYDRVRVVDDRTISLASDPYKMSAGQRKAARLDPLLNMVAMARKGRAVASR